MSASSHEVALIAIQIEGRTYRERITGLLACERARVAYDRWPRVRRRLLREHGWVHGAGQSYFDLRADLAREMETSIARMQLPNVRRLLADRIVELVALGPEAHPRHWLEVLLQYRALQVRLREADGEAWWVSLGWRRGEVVADYLLAPLAEILQRGTVDAPLGARATRATQGAALATSAQTAQGLECGYHAANEETEP